MSADKLTTKKSLSLLLSGRHPQVKKYEGKHVFVIKNKVFLLPDGSDSLDKFKTLKKKYGEPPVLVFVPRTDISYNVLKLPTCN